MHNQKVFVTVIEDRHADLDVHVWNTFEEANVYAEAVIDEYAREWKYLPSEKIIERFPDLGIVWRCRPGENGDCASADIYEREIPQ